MKKSIILGTLAIAALALSATNADAQSNRQVIKLAHSIQGISKDLKSEFRSHYTRSAAYNHLQKDVNQLISKANHIDELAHNPRTSYNHIKTDLAELDRLAHHIHDLVDDVDRGRYAGTVSGNTRHVHQKLSSLNNNIHSMQRAIVVFAPTRGCGSSYVSTPSCDRSTSCSPRGRRASSNCGTRGDCGTNAAPVANNGWFNNYFARYFNF